MAWISFFILLSLCVYVVTRAGFFRMKGLDTSALLLALTLKISAGVGLYLLYTYYYSDQSVSDIHKYFADAELWKQLLRNDISGYLKLLSGIGLNEKDYVTFTEQMRFWDKINHYGLYNDNRTMIRLNAFLLLFSGGHYATHALFFGFIGFLGSCGLYKAMTIWFGPAPRFYFFCCFAFPSVLIWTSGISKEALVWVFLGLFLYHLASLTREKFTWERLLWVLIFFVLLGLSKIYLAAFFLTVLPGYLLLKKIRKGGVFSVLGIQVLLLGLGLGISVYQYRHVPTMDPLRHKSWEEFAKENPKFVSELYAKSALGDSYNIVDKLRCKQQDFIVEAKTEGAGSYVELPRLNGRADNLLVRIPGAILRGLYSPWPWEYMGLLYLLPVAERLFLLFLTAGILFFPSKFKGDSGKEAGLLLGFVLSTACFMGLLIPVLGNLVRYTMPVLPLFAMVLASGTRWQESGRLRKFFREINKDLTLKK
jgi:hypothetical protein